MKEIRSLLDRILSPYKDSDSIVLGCTHYPLIKDYIKNIIKCDIIDMSDYLEIEEGTTSSLNIYFNKLDDKIKNNINNILKK